MNDSHIEVREFRSHLSKYLRQVQQGQTVIITDHGHPVGRLSPVEQSLEERIKALQEAGLVAWNGQKLKEITPPVTNHGERQVSEIVVEMRV